MSFLWTSISGVLVVELIVLLTLCAPLPWGVRKNITRWIFRVRAQQRLESFLKYILFALVLAFAESVHSIRTLHVRREFQSTADGHQDPGLQLAALQDFRWQKARAERNLYMASFAITAIIAIGRLIRLASIEMQLRNKIKQYNGNRPLTETGETIVDKAE